MLIEATTRPIRYRLRSGEEILLEPGVPTEVPHHAATQLLQRGEGIVRVVQSGHTVIEPAASRPVYWETADGPIIGPAIPEYLANVQENGRDTFWVIVTHDGLPRWIRSDRLRSQRDFERQPAFRIEEPIRDR